MPPPIHHRKIGFWEAFSIGVGGMIGGGIFAVLGLTVELAKGAAPIAFFVAGLIALATSYSYAKLSVRYPSEGGTIEYLVRAFGNNVAVGGLNILLLLSYVIMLSLYAYAFGGYGSALMFGHEVVIWRHILATFVIALFTFLNMLGAYIVGKAEDALVGFKVAILMLFGFAGLMTIELARLSPANWPSPINIIAGGMMIFLAYEGFELIANTAQDVEEPESTLPKAFILSVVFVMFIYILVAIVTVGNLPYQEVVRARDYALAEAAKPFLGEIGFILIGFAALASTASAINATLYGSARVSYMVARYGELPKIVEKKIWKAGYEGLLMVAVLALLATNLLNLSGISLAGSTGFLIIFASVNFACAKLRRETRANPVLPVIGGIAATAALAILLYNSAIKRPEELIPVAIIVASSFIIEALYRAISGRRIKEYVDWRLRERIKMIEEWHKWVPKVVEHVEKEVPGVKEIYLVGSVARGELEKAHDVDLLVVASKKIEKKEARELRRRIEEKAKLPYHHPLHIHFTTPEEKKKWLEKSKQYKKIK
ncbi:MAG: amino acid permease [Crenarchaeota archaeon]|nr:amino acid permease [Thermoproteota archaeon]